MSVGLIFFTLADSKVNPNFEAYGITLVLGALVADAVIGNLQEKTMKDFNSSNIEMVLYSYSIGFIYILLWELFVTYRLFEAIEFCTQVCISFHFYLLLSDMILLHFLFLKLTEPSKDIWIYIYFFY